MTMTQHRLIQTYKKYLILPGAFILLGSTCCNSVNAVEFGSIKYHNTFIDYSNINKASTEKLADFYFNKALNTKDKNEKSELLQKASGEYFVLTKLEPENLHPLVQLARVYDYENKNSYSKAYFFRALKIDKKNAATNYHFGDYYFARDEYKKALYFYNTAFENGYKENYDVLLKMAVMYEKLGDLLRANQYYKKAYLVKPENLELPDKIREIESLRYKNTGYYNFRRNKK